MENTAKNIREENRRIVQDGLDRRAEARAIVAQEARMEAYERDMINLCNANAAKNSAKHISFREERVEVNLSPEHEAKQCKATTRQAVKNMLLIFMAFCTVLFFLRTAEDFGASATVVILLAALATVVASACVIWQMGAFSRKLRKRRGAR